MAMRTGWDANGACGLRGSVSSHDRCRSRNDPSRTGAETVASVVGPGTVPGTAPGTVPGTDPGTTAVGGRRATGGASPALALSAGQWQSPTPHPRYFGACR